MTDLSLTTGGIGSGEPVAFDAALQLRRRGRRGVTAALAASAVVAIEPNGVRDGHRRRDERHRLNAGGGAPARELEATATRIAFDRTAETLAVEGLVTEIAGIRRRVATVRQLRCSPIRPSAAASPSSPRRSRSCSSNCRCSPPHRDRAERARHVRAGRREFSLQTEPQVVQLTGVNAELLGMHVTGEGSLTGANELAGHVVIGEFTPNAARPSAAARRPCRRPSTSPRLGTLALDTRFDTSLDTGRAALRDFELRALGATISGTIEGSARRARQRLPRRASQRRGSRRTRSRRRSRRCCRRTSRRASSA